MGAAALAVERVAKGKPLSLGKMWLGITGVSVLMGLIYLIPPAGVLFSSLLMLVGLGALALHGYGSFRLGRG